MGHQHPESVTNILNLSPTHLVSNIRHQHRCNPFSGIPDSGVPKASQAPFWKTSTEIVPRIKDKLGNMFRLAELYFEDRDIDKEFRKIFLQSFHPIKKRKITQKIEAMVSSRQTLIIF